VVHLDLIFSVLTFRNDVLDDVAKCAGRIRYHSEIVVGGQIIALRF
jgi:hypothetical protein